jgi:hypothetical protein
MPQFLTASAIASRHRIRFERCVLPSIPFSDKKLGVHALVVLSVGCALKVQAL